MVRLLGAALVAAGTAWMGHRAATALGARAQALEEMAQGLSSLARELELEGAPLARLMERLEGGVRGPAKRLVQGCRRALGRLDEENFPQAWRRLAGGLAELGEAGAHALLPLGDVLGRCSREQQRMAVDCVRRRLEELAAQARQEYAQQGKVYRVLGCSAGAFFIILLL